MGRSTCSSERNQPPNCIGHTLVRSTVVSCARSQVWTAYTAGPNYISNSFSNAAGTTESYRFGARKDAGAVIMRYEVHRHRPRDVLVVAFRKSWNYIRTEADNAFRTRSTPFNKAWHKYNTTPTANVVREQQKETRIVNRFTTSSAE